MKFKRSLTPGILLKRYKRFLADVRLIGGKKITAHCPNTGSMLGCAEPGSPVLLSHHFPSKRKYPYTFEMVFCGTSWIGINTSLTNTLVEEGIKTGKIRSFNGYPQIKREVTVQNSRIDFQLSNGKHQCYVEVKNVTLGEKGVAYFPDAVTERGTKHLRTLLNLKRKGYRSVMCFVIQREDCELFRPADDIDSVYGKTLRQVIKKGVEILVCGAKVGPKEIVINRMLPFQL